MLFVLTGHGTRRTVKVEAPDIRAAVEEVCGWSEFEPYDLRKVYHDDGLGAYLGMDLPLGVNQLYEIRRLNVVLDVS